MQVFPTVPSPTTTHFIGLPELMIYLNKKINIISVHYIETSAIFTFYTTKKIIKKSSIKF